MPGQAYRSTQERILSTGQAPPTTGRLLLFEAAAGECWFDRNTKDELIQ